MPPRPKGPKKGQYNIRLTDHGHEAQVLIAKEMGFDNVSEYVEWLSLEAHKQVLNNAGKHATDEEKTTITIAGEDMRLYRKIGFQSTTQESISEAVKNCDHELYDTGERILCHNCPYDSEFHDLIGLVVVPND